MFRDFISVLTFLTVIPINLNFEYDENRFTRGVIYFPVVGLLIGILNVLIFYSVSFISKGFLPVIFVVFFEIAINGGLHLDGLADTCDAFFSARKVSKMLEIMKDSRIGTHGVAGILFDIIFKIFLLYELKENTVFFVLAMPIISRGFIIIYMYNAKYARAEGGLASPYLGKISTKNYLMTIITTLVLTIVIFGYKGIILFLITILFSYLYKNYIIKKINGITGDILGSSVELSEIVFLFGGVLLNCLK